MLNEKMKYDAPEDELTARIDSFMTRQRREVLEKIYERGRISHKELAAAIGSTPTSLWNICQNFRSFQPELIKSEAQGRFKYYGLTETAVAYLRRKMREAGADRERAVTTAFPGSAEKRAENRRAVEECAIELLKQNDGNLDLILENYFINFLHGDIFRIDAGQLPLLDRMFRAVRELILSDDPFVYDEFFDKYLDSQILRNRMDAYMGPFYSLNLLYRLLSDESRDSWELCRMLDAAFEGDTAYDYKDLGMTEDQYAGLCSTLSWICTRESGKGQQGICEDLQRTFSCGNMLSVLLTDRIRTYYKKLGTGCG